MRDARCPAPHYVKLRAMSESLELCRTFDAGRVNALINDPSIRPSIGGDGVSVLDLTAAVENRDNHFMLGEHGGFAYSWSAPGIYEVHTMILPAGRGPYAAHLAKASLDYITDAGAEKVWTRVPADAPNVRIFCRRQGFQLCGSQTLDLGGGPVAYDLYQWRPECP